MSSLAYRCPVCQHPLQLTLRTLQCDNRHSFDLAREGYVNLLPVNRKKTSDPGDNKEMMQARRKFLDAGHYAPLVHRLTEIVVPLQPETLLDNGCGEGYYTSKLAAAGVQCDSYGVDISRNAIRYASKRYPSIQFSVASAYELPFIDASFDLICRIYAPSKAEELNRCLKPGGHLLTVTPASHHLFELKQKIYNEPRLHSFKPEQLPDMEPVTHEQLTLPLVITDADSFVALLKMTPFAWKLDSKTRLQLLDQIPFELTLDFHLQLLRKKDF